MKPERLPSKASIDVMVSGSLGVGQNLVEVRLLPGCSPGDNPGLFQPWAQFRKPFGFEGLL